MSLLKSILRILKKTFSYLLLVAVIVFMVNNREIVTLQLYPFPFELETRLFLVIIFFFLFGLIFGLIFCSQNIVGRIIESLKDKYRIKKLENQVKETQKNQ